MATGAEFPTFTTSDLYAQLARGLAAGATVVTPNQRLAAALAGDFDRHQQAQRLPAWETADILPLAALIERFYEDGLYSDFARELPLLLDPAQEQALWEQVVSGSEAGTLLLSAPGAATLAREAWKQAHAWRLASRLNAAPANDDARVFADWAWRYAGITARDRLCDRARLADAIIPRLAHPALRKPRLLIAYGFDMLDPQSRDVLGALREAGVEVVQCRRAARSSRTSRLAFASAKDEIVTAARWARSRLEADPGARIGVVVPDLAETRNSVRRIFSQVMDPGAMPAGESSMALPFNISIGEPLSSTPLAAAALLLLELAGTASAGETGFAGVSRIIRSPFIAGAQAELAQRAQLEAALRAACAQRTDIESLRRAIARLTDERNPHRVRACAVLVDRLAKIAVFARDNLRGARRPGEWAKIVLALCEAAGFPGERALDSAEYQTLKKFHETVAALAALDRVTGRVRFGEARERLQRIAADTLFQPEAGDVTIQVLGVLESAGLAFDHLWVMGLTDEAWPMRARPNPFIPVALAREAGVPQASAAASFDLDSRITRDWIEAAGEVVLSHPLRAEDRELAPSPLIRALPLGRADELALPEYESLHAVLHRARRDARLPDARAPSLLAPSRVGGGTGVFRDQAACPFRAFAAHRLGAIALDSPPPGLSAAERGTLLHAMLAKIWRELGTSAALDAAGDTDIDALLADAAAHALDRVRRMRPDALSGRFAALEQARLVRLGKEWLEREKQRPAFEAVAIEQPCSAAFGGIAVNARIDRIDRIVGSGLAVIDYKSGRASVEDWLGPRPEDPQLPLYAVSTLEAAGAVTGSVTGSVTAATPGATPGAITGAAAAADGSVAAREAIARGETLCAVAIGRVRAGEMAFAGIAGAAGLIPGVGTIDARRSAAAKDYASWEALLAAWRGELESLGAGFMSGEARVDPRRGEPTCRWCGFHALCRINERAGMAPEEDL